MPGTDAHLYLLGTKKVISTIFFELVTKTVSKWYLKFFVLL